MKANDSSTAVLVVLGLFLCPPAVAEQGQERVDDRTVLDLGSGALFHQASSRDSVPQPTVNRGPLPLAITDAYVGCSFSDDAYSFDLATLVPGPSIEIMPESNYPYDATMKPDRSEVWIPGASGDGVAVIDHATNVVTHRIPLGPDGQYSVGLAFSGDGSLALVSNRDTENISVVDTSTYSVASTIQFPANMEPGNLAWDPVGGRFFVVEWYAEQLFEVAGNGSAVTDWAVVGDSLWQLVVDPAGTYVYVTDRGTDQLLVVDPDSLAVVNSVAVGDDPWGLDVTADGGKLVVACEDSHDVYIIDTTSWGVTVIPLDADADPRDVDISDADRKAYVVGGRVSSATPNPVYVIDLDGDRLETVFDIPGCSNTNVIAVQEQQAGGGCPAVLDPVEAVMAFKPVAAISDVRLQWRSNTGAHDGYNVWRVSRKQDIPIAADPPQPGVVEVCLLADQTFCVHVGGASQDDGSPLYYQVKAVCDGIEGP
jgi:YVTN family beta-propeller protein